MLLQGSNPKDTMSEVSARRASRQRRDSARAAAARREGMRAGGASGSRYNDSSGSADPTTADAVWAARKRRIQDLIADDGASSSSLKRELKMLLGYADATRSAARSDRCELAGELNAMVAPLVREISSLQRRLASNQARLAKAEGKAETAPLVEAAA